MRKIVCILGLFLAATAAQASDLSIGLSDKMVSLDFTGATKNSALQMNMGGLHHEDNGQIATLGVQVSQKVNRDVEASIGFKGVGIFNDYKNASAIALGGTVDFALPMVQKLYLGAHGWYAPSVVTYNHAENFRDFGANLNLRLLDNAAVFVGYRYVRVNYEKNVDLRIFEGAQAGIKLIF